ncbi:hypothetical protein QTG58_001906 [Vibrio parahaemolyticus]|uniref:hypothetical protein n=1 Tax=Vibrio parahaemolyticus TaxID=670 RepID=UPI0012AE9DD3|nr:hypothetical protein [Vibrio parahaemolyticus]ELA9557232.1 hypothetical protein [Vibrio parahaemolyticus]
MITTAWGNFLSTLNDLQLNRILAICFDRLSNGNRFPPSLGELMTQINQRTEAEYREAYDRFLNRAPMGRAEKWVAQNCDWDLKRARAGGELELFIKYLRDADAKERAGRLRLAEDELKALPVHSRVSVSDKVREEYRRSGEQHEFSDRIDQLRAMKR